MSTTTSEEAALEEESTANQEHPLEEGAEDTGFVAFDLPFVGYLSVDRWKHGVQRSYPWAVRHAINPDSAEDADKIFDTLLTKIDECTSPPSFWAKLSGYSSLIGFAAFIISFFLFMLITTLVVEGLATMSHLTDYWLVPLLLAMIVSVALLLMGSIIACYLQRKFKLKVVVTPTLTKLNEECKEYGLSFELVEFKAKKLAQKAADAGIHVIRVKVSNEKLPENYKCLLLGVDMSAKDVEDKNVEQGNGAGDEAVLGGAPVASTASRDLVRVLSSPLKLFSETESSNLERGILAHSLSLAINAFVQTQKSEQSFGYGACFSMFLAAFVALCSELAMLTAFTTACVCFLLLIASYPAIGYYMKITSNRLFRVVDQLEVELNEKVDSSSARWTVHRLLYRGNLQVDSAGKPLLPIYLEFLETEDMSPPLSSDSAVQEALLTEAFLKIESPYATAWQMFRKEFLFPTIGLVLLEVLLFLVVYNGAWGRLHDTIETMTDAWTAMVALGGGFVFAFMALTSLKPKSVAAGVSVCGCVTSILFTAAFLIAAIGVPPYKVRQVPSFWDLKLESAEDAEMADAVHPVVLEFGRGLRGSIGEHGLECKCEISKLSPCNPQPVRTKGGTLFCAFPLIFRDDAHGEFSLVPPDTVYTLCAIFDENVSLPEPCSLVNPQACFYNSHCFQFESCDEKQSCPWNSCKNLKDNSDISGGIVDRSMIRTLLVNGLVSNGSVSALHLTDITYYLHERSVERQNYIAVAVPFGILYLIAIFFIVNYEMRRRAKIRQEAQVHIPQPQAAGSDSTVSRRKKRAGASRRKKYQHLVEE